VSGAGALVLPPALVWPVGVVVAAMLGSFLNVCISRLPRGQSIVLPRSHCPVCRAPIRARDNIPLVSFALLGGRCRACAAPISWRYPAVEALAILVGGLALWSLGPTWDGARVFLLGLVLVTVTFTDLETRRIPDRVTLPAVVAALVLAPEGLGRGSLGAVLGAGLLGLARAARPAAEPSPADPDEAVDPAERRRLDVYWAAAWGALAGRQAAVLDLDGLRATQLPLAWRVLGQVDGPVAGCLVVGGLFFLVAWGSQALLGRTGLGGGDVKLAALIGAALGTGAGLVAAFLGVLLGGLAAAILLATGLRRFGEYLPLGPFLAAGGLGAGLWAPAILGWYLG
jgi:prepilin signal peptidase PulO-like enzyme (type II secretory pathway)